MPRVRLGLILTALVLVTCLPLAALAAWLTSTSGAQHRALIEAQNIDRVQGISAAIDLEIERTMGELMALATLDPIDAADLGAFTQMAARLLPLHPSWTAVRLIDPSLTVVASTDPAAQAVFDPIWAREIFDRRRGGVSTVRTDAAGDWVVNAGVPVVRGQTVRYILAARVRSKAFGEFLRQQQPPEGGVITLLDADQTIIARTRNEERYVGSRPTQDFIDRSRSGPSGSWRTVLLEGTPAFSAWYRSSVTGWTVGLGMPSDAIDRAVRRHNQVIVAAGAATLGGGLLIALLLGRTIVRAQVAAATSARQLARGEPVPAVRSYIKDADDLGLALHDAAGILEQRIAERDAAAAALNRAKDDFVATVSHELRTPLNAIYGWVAMLRTGSLDPTRQAHALTVIERNARAQLQVVEDLLDMSTIVHGRLRLDRSAVDLTKVVRSVVDSVAPAADERGTTIEVDTPGTPVMVTGDQARLQQIVWNLVSNAMKFTSPSTGRLDVAVSTNDHHAIVTVRDNGEGIARDFMPFVFDRFRQETELVTRQHFGLGIGLALARTLTEMHGGTISADSAGKGTGATFTVRLPLRRAAAETAAPSTPDRLEAGPR